MASGGPEGGWGAGRYVASLDCQQLLILKREMISREDTRTVMQKS